MLSHPADGGPAGGTGCEPTAGPGPGLALDEATLGRFELLGLASAVTAALDAGVLKSLLAGGPRTAGEIAAELDLRPAPLERVLDLLATTGLVREENGDAPRYAAGELLAALRRHGPAFREMELSIWGRLPELLDDADSEPRSPAGDRGRMYAEIARDLVKIEEPAALRLAAELECPGARVLDVGCGAGVWSLALAEANPELRVTGLDLPEVVPRFLERARKLGVAHRTEALAGDMASTELEAGGYDLAIVANVLRLESRGRARRLVERIGRAVADDGALLVIDAFPGSSARSRRLHAAYRLHLGLRSRSGDTLDPDRIAGWLEEEGFSRVQPLELGTEGPLRGLMGRR